MTKTKQKIDPATALCNACGLCCTGHLFVHTELQPAEVQTARALGLDVFQYKPKTPAFHLPCPRWEGHCTVHTHSHKPSICGEFKCKLLREVEAGQLPLTQALAIVERAKKLIRELEAQIVQITVRRTNNFRLNLFECLSQTRPPTLLDPVENAFRLKAGVLLILYTQRFGVQGLFNQPEPEP